MIFRGLVRLAEHVDLPGGLLALPRPPALRHDLRILLSRGASRRRGPLGLIHLHILYIYCNSRLMLYNNRLIYLILYIIT